MTSRATGERTDGATENGARSKRITKLTRKALQNAIEGKQKLILKSRKELLSVMLSVEQLSDDSQIESLARQLSAASEEFGRLLQDLFALYEQDTDGEYLEEAHLNEENETLKRALILIDRLKNRIVRKSNKLLETQSVCSRQSLRHSSVSKTSSAIARLQALADAKAAREEAQYTRLIAEKELERKTRDAETQRIQQQEKAEFEKEMSILGADRKAAIANAKLKVYEEALLEEELGKAFESPELDIPKIKAEERTSQWVHSSPTLDPPLTRNLSRAERTREPPSQEQTKPLSPSGPKLNTSEKTTRLPQPHVRGPDLPDRRFANHNRGMQENTVFNRQPLLSSTPLKDITGSQLIDSLAAVNQQIVASLARQNLPKCQPDV